MQRRPTLADIAARADLSTTSVSMILNDRQGTGLSAETAERVRAIAAELRYRPNPAARSLRLGKTATVGFISDDVTVTRYASAMIRGMLDVAEKLDHTVLIAEVGHSVERMTAAVDAMVDRNTDGIIFGAMAARLIDLPALPPGLPVVVVNAASADGRPNVLPDEFRAGYEITKRLLTNTAHNRVAILGTRPAAEIDPKISVTIYDRFEGIRSALRDAGVDVVAHKDLEAWDPDLSFHATLELLDEGIDFNALICLNDNVSFGAYQAFSERGIRVPTDVSVVSFDDDEFASYLRPPLTTARLPYEEMGRCAMEFILDGNRPTTIPRVHMPIQVRESI